VLSGVPELCNLSMELPLPHERMRCVEVPLTSWPRHELLSLAIPQLCCWSILQLLLTMTQEVGWGALAHMWGSSLRVCRISVVDNLAPIIIRHTIKLLAQTCARAQHPI
jgi:hypothetical protein